MIQSVVILERTCEASQSVVIWEGTRIALDPNGGQVWGELVERSKERSLWREHVERSKVWSFWSERVERSKVWSFEGGL